MYAQVIEEEIVQIVNEQSLRELYPSTHFPSPILQAHLEGFDNWYVVQDDLSIPEYDAKNKRIEFTREWNAGAVVGSYKVLNLTKAEKDALVESRWNEVKYHRNNTINATDYLGETYLPLSTLPSSTPTMICRIRGTGNRNKIQPLKYTASGM